MSFSPDIRASGNFQRMFNKANRRIYLQEIPKSDIDTLQEHVNELRTQGHFVDISNVLENISTIALGPHDYIFEPDYNTVKIRTNFKDVHGIDNYQFQTLNSVDYHAIELYDQAAISAQLWYCCATLGIPTNDLDISTLWNWNIGFHPPSVKQGNSIHLNVGDSTKCLLSIQNMGTDFDFTANTLSISFWIYPTDVSNSGTPRVVAYRRIDANNKWSIEIDTDGKLFVIFMIAGVQTKRQYDTVLTANNWYHICVTWNNTGPALVLKVNNNADTSSTKVSGTGVSDNRMSFGSYPGATTSQDFKGYLACLTYYKNTVLSASEIGNLYLFNTKSVTSKPMTWGIGQYGPSYSILFDGSNDYLDLGTQSSLWSQTKTKFSFSFWLKTNALAAGFPILLISTNWGVTNGSILAYRTTTTGTVGVGIWQGGEVDAENVTTYPAGDFTNWYNITGVYDSTLGSANLKVYVNGIVGGTTGNATTTTNPNDSVWLSANSGGHNGNIDNFKYWYNVALTSTQVNNHYNNTGDYPTPSYWLKMNEGTGNPVDSIGAKTTTLQNGASWSTLTY